MKIRTSFAEGRRVLGHLPILTGVLALVACAPDAEDEAASPREPEAAVAAAIVSARVDPTIPKYPASWPANAPKIVAVKHNGTGCPPGTFGSYLSPDGTDLWINFSSLEAFVDGKSRKIDVKSCQVALTFQSAEPAAVVLEGLRFEGYAYLDAHVKARQTVTANFRGSGRENWSLRFDAEAPFDDYYVVHSDDVHEKEIVSSPCGTSSDLDLSTLIRAEATTSTGSGYINVAVLVREPGVHLKLAWKSCQAPETDAGSSI